jgi:hypothetical protein
MKPRSSKKSQAFYCHRTTGPFQQFANGSKDARLDLQVTLSFW